MNEFISIKGNNINLNNVQNVQIYQTSIIINYMKGNLYCTNYKIGEQISESDVYKLIRFFETKSALVI